MSRDNILEILKSQIKNTKDFTLDGVDDYNVIYTYNGKKHQIMWDSNYKYKYGNYVWFRYIYTNCTYTKSSNWGVVIITEKSIEKDNKNILKKLRILSSRIRKEDEIETFIEKIKKEFTQKVKNYILRDLKLNDIKMDFSYSQVWNNYKDKNKLILRFVHLTILTSFSHENIKYQYSFKCVHPSKWESKYYKIESKEITLLIKNVIYPRKKITNIIRYAKLKNIFSNV